MLSWSVSRHLFWKIILFFSKITSKINKKEGNNWAVTPLILLSVSFHWSLRNERRISIRMTRHCPELGGTSDWLNQISHAAQPIRRTTQIWVVTRHHNGISALVSQTSFGGETSGSVAKCRLFSQAVCLLTELIDHKRIEYYWGAKPAPPWSTFNFSKTKWQMPRGDGHA